MKFNFRKIASVASSALMVASTVALAAAANYPAPFVQGGTANVGIVWGGNGASSTDLVAAANIQSSLASALADQATGNGGDGGNSVSGEAYELFTSSSPLLLNASLNSIKSSVTNTGLPTILAETTFSGNVDADITFAIHMGSNPRTVFAKQPTSSDDPQTGILLGATAGNYLYNATSTFSQAVNFSHADSLGEEIELFGQKFTVSSSTTATSLILFKSADTVFLTVGGDSPHPSEEVIIDGVNYLVELTAASDTAATIRLTNVVTGETDQKEISEAQSKKVLDVDVAVDTADENNFQLSAQVIIGASKMTLADGEEVKIGSDSDPIDGTQIDFGGGTYTGNLTSLTLQVFAGDGSHDFVIPGNALVDPVFGSFKVDFSGLEESTREDIEIKVSGNDKMTIGFTNWQGKSVTSQEWLNNESAPSFLGDASDYRFFVQENSKINETAYAVVGNEDEGYLVRLRTLSNASSATASDDSVIFENVLDTEQSWTASITSEGAGTIEIGGKSYTINYWDDRDGDNDEYVQLNYPESTGNDVIFFPTIETKEGAKLAFYEPMVVNVANWNAALGGGTGSNMTEAWFPDGDGYTEITTTAGGIDNVWTIGGRSVNLTNTGSFAVGENVGVASYVNAGPLTYNFTAAIASGSAGTGSLGRVSDADKNNNQTLVITLMDPSSNVSIYHPAIVMFSEQDDANNYNAVVVRTSGSGTSDNGVGVADVDFTWNVDTAMDGTAYGTSGLQLESDDDMYQMMDIWGAKVSVDQSTSDQYTAVISYPDNQVVANVYVAEESAVISGSGSNGGSTSLGEIIVEDSEVTQVATKNLIVVGGSCVNEVAATLLGSDSALCGSDFESASGVGSGSFLIQTFDSEWGDNRVATLVAGYNAADTTNAATFLRTQTVMTGIGNKYIGTSGTEATLQTG